MREHIKNATQKKLALNNDIKVGSEVCFFEGKKDRPVAYDSLGKVILCKHDISLGYAKVKTVEEKDNFYLVTAEHIIKDVYSGINYDEFLKVLPLHGYKVGFDRIFKHNSLSMGEYIDEHQIFAYNLQNKVVITAETFNWDDKQKNQFNTIRIYLPGANCFSCGACYYKMFSQGNGEMSIFDAGSTSRNETDVLARMNELAERFGGDWPADEYPSLWTYAKSDNVEHDDDGNWILGEWSLQRLKLADPECLQIFKGCNWLKELV